MPIIEWEAPEFEYIDKRPRWYHASIVLSVIILAFALWQKNFLFGLFVIVAEVLVMVWGNRAPRSVRFRMSENIFEIVDEKAYPYTNMQSFSIAENKGSDWDRLTFRFRKRLTPLLSVVVPKHQTEDIRTALKEILDETEPEQSAIDDLQKFVKF